MAVYYKLATIFIFFHLANAQLQVPEKLTQNPCVSKSTCHECIQTPSCAWCFKPDFEESPRCFQPSGTGKITCPEEYVWNPDNIIQVMVDKELSKAHAGGMSASASGAGYESSYSGSSHHSSSSSSSSFHSSSASGESNIVQIAPQRVKLQLRARQSYSLNVHYTQAVDYPVDLYYLMDLSKSMEDDKDKLSLLGNLLAESMRNITSNFRLGFGSFVDKVVMPYVSTVPKKLEAPCRGCKPPYGYRNHMKLSTDTSKFSTMVKEAAVSGNLDAPEGGFDAIMQAVVCKDEIGWRDKARKLLVFSTDAGFHYAGDGKLGGIVKPNDGLCHLRNGMYTESSYQDYPSVSQINYMVKQNSINLIFAVTDKQIHIYKKLKENIEGASCGQLSNDSSNVVDLVKEQYQQISSSVEMKDNATSAIKINYFSKCLDGGSTDKKTNKCGGIKVGDVVTFRVEIEVTKCPKDPKDWQQTIQLYPVGINESLIIDLEMLCSCPCEYPGNLNYKEKPEECNYSGTYKCGICECDESHFGRHCECSATAISDFNSTMGCRKDNLTKMECSGRGNCVCGRCECDIRSNPDEKIYGNFCECDNFSCDRHDGQLCSGPSHGICECGQCTCKDSWGGNACECKLSTETCYAPDVLDGEICSGHGECQCGTCVCDSTEEGRYSGRYCEKCPTCSDRCEEFKHCVQCQMYKKGPYDKETCATNCTKFVPLGVEKVEANEANNEYLCAFYDEDDCRYAYVYYFDEHNKIVVEAQEQLECPQKVFLIGIIFGVIAAIVLIGLAVLLLWKLLTTIHDRREFARFEKERMMAKWDTGENPIYKQATSTFKNPTYAGKG